MVTARRPRKQIVLHQSVPDWHGRIAGSQCSRATGCAACPAEYTAGTWYSAASVAVAVTGTEAVVLAEKCHPLGDQLVSPNNPKGLFILSGGFSNECAFSASTT